MCHPASSGDMSSAQEASICRRLKASSPALSVSLPFPGGGHQVCSASYALVQTLKDEFVLPVLTLIGPNKPALLQCVKPDHHSLLSSMIASMADSLAYSYQRESVESVRHRAAHPL
jgi:hypothetical protein